MKCSFCVQSMQSNINPRRSATVGANDVPIIKIYTQDECVIASKAKECAKGCVKLQDEN